MKKWYAGHDKSFSNVVASVQNEPCTLRFFRVCAHIISLNYHWYILEECTGKVLGTLFQPVIFTLPGRRHSCISPLSLICPSQPFICVGNARVGNARVGDTREGDVCEGDACLGYAHVGDLGHGCVGDVCRLHMCM